MRQVSLFFLPSKVKRRFCTKKSIFPKKRGESRRRRSEICLIQFSNDTFKSKNIVAIRTYIRSTYGAAYLSYTYALYAFMHTTRTNTYVRTYAQMAVETAKLAIAMSSQRWPCVLRRAALDKKSRGTGDQSPPPHLLMSVLGVSECCSGHFNVFR